MQNSVFQKIIKIAVAALLLIIIAVLGYVAGGVVKYNIDIRKADKAVERFQESLEQPYKEDTYGGKTPEETWAMFLDALRKRDIDLASRYFAVNSQKKAAEWLEKFKQENKLNQIIKEMDTFHKSDVESLENQANYAYYYFDEEFNETLSSSVIFYLNPYTKVWKILY